MVNFSESFKNFLLSEKDKGSSIARLIINAMALSEDYPIYKNVLTTSEVDYITMRPDGLLSYLPAGKTHKVNDRGEWMRDGRQSGKPAKVIRKIFSEKILKHMQAKSFESFGNAYKAKFMDNGFVFELKQNRDIPDVYDMERVSGDGSLNNSCMNGDTEYLEIYKHCEHVRILTLTNKDGLLCGRALVWNVKHKDHGDITFMDRIYVVEDYMYDLFTNHARTVSWWRKSSFKSFENKTTWVNPDTDETETMHIELYTSTDYDHYPYIDTFCYGNNGDLNNHNRGDYTYNNTDGTRDGEDEEDNHEDEYYDEINEEYIDQYDAVCLCDEGDREYRGRYTHTRNAVEAYVNGRGRSTEWFHENDSHIVEVNGNWYVTDHEDIVYRHDGEYDLYENCVLCETDQEWYECNDSDLIQSEDGEWFHVENDDNVICVFERDSTDTEYVYLPDHEDDVVEIENEHHWYWKDDTRIEEIELMQNDDTEMVWVIALSIVKHGRKRYHKDDQRLIALIARTNKRLAAQTTIVYE